MVHRALLALVGGLLCSSSLLANDWANQMFADRNHDFGSVARAAKTEHVFEFTNPLDQPLHVQSVRASCGCTTPTILTETVAPGATGKIQAQFNTRSFLGQRGATITVVFDRPRYGEAQLRVDGYVRRDVVCSPGEVDFGAMRAGVEQEKRIEVNYAGRSDWKIEAVSTTVPGLNVTVEETSRANGRVAYLLIAKLNSTETGFVTGEIELTTNDNNFKTVPLVVSGQVNETIAISPNPLVLGAVSCMESTKKKVVLRSDSPFKITSFRCEDPRISVELPTESKALQLVPITFTATEAAGPVEFVVVLETDLPETSSIKIQGQIEVNQN